MTIIGRSIQHLKNIGVHDEWETPPDLYDEACEKYGIKPVMDVAAQEHNTKCDMFITADSLTHDWNLDFFCNPPYSQVREFIQKASEESKKHKVDGLILVYAKTDTRWWHDFVEDKAEYHFIRGRVKFLDASGKPSKNSAPYGSVWIIFRANA